MRNKNLESKRLEYICLEIKPRYILVYGSRLCRELLVSLYHVLCTEELDVKLRVLLTMALTLRLLMSYIYIYIYIYVYIWSTNS